MFKHVWYSSAGRSYDVSNFVGIHPKLFCDFCTISNNFILFMYTQIRYYAYRVIR